MMKFYVIGLALLGVLALGVITASGASAEIALWLVNGAEASEQEIEMSGEFTVIYLAGGFLEPETITLCSSIFDGLILSGGKATVDTMLNLAKEQVTLAKMIECTNDKNCPAPLVSAENLPWNGLLELMGTEAEPDYLVSFSSGGNGPPAYEIACMGLGIETLCEGEPSLLLALMMGSSNLLGIMNAEGLELEGLEANCEAHMAVVDAEGEGEFVLAEGGELDVS